MFFSRKGKRIERVLVLDIGSGSVGVGIASVFDNESETPALIEAVFRSPIELKGEFDFSLFLKSTEEALDSCLKYIQDKKIKKPDKALMVFASPWYNASPRTASFSKGSSFVFSEKEIQTVLKNEREAFFKEISKDTTENINDFIILDETVHSVDLNGYPQNDPMGKVTKSVSIKMFITVTEKIVFERIKLKIKNFFPHIEILSSSFMNSLFVTLRDTKMIEDDTILIDVGGEMTEIVKISYGTINSVASFPSGRMKLIRKMQENNLEKNFLKLYERSELSQIEVENIEKIFRLVLEDWENELKNTLFKFGGGFLKAKKVFLIMDEDVTKIFNSSVASVVNALIPTNSPEVILINPEKIASYVKFADKVPKDEFLMIETIFARRKIFE